MLVRAVKRESGDAAFIGLMLDILKCHFIVLSTNAQKC